MNTNPSKVHHWQHTWSRRSYSWSIRRDICWDMSFRPIHKPREELQNTCWCKSVLEIAKWKLTLITTYFERYFMDPLISNIKCSTKIENIIMQKLKNTEHLLMHIGAENRRVQTWNKDLPILQNKLHKTTFRECNPFE